MRNNVLQSYRKDIIEENNFQVYVNVWAVAVTTALFCLFATIKRLLATFRIISFVKCRYKMCKICKVITWRQTLSLSDDLIAYT